MSTGVPQVEAGKIIDDNKSDSANDQYASFTRPGVARDDLLARPIPKRCAYLAPYFTSNAVPLLDVDKRCKIQCAFRH